jgi:UDP-N-acetylglucosamine--N-acetylmuramyl-(pentapeptide) pyrophosphoryl-undecaprenol N-acetylglucosamine transferase
MTPLEVLWIGTDRKVEVDALSAAPWIHRTLRVMPIKGTGLAGRIKAVFMLPAACIRAMIWLREFRPHVVLGVGGYVSGPVMLAARNLRIPAAIHEQNMVPGLANRMAARFARKVFVTYSDSARYFRDVEIEVTGNPVRQAIIEAGRSAERDDEGHRLTLLILGGSQGAAGLNRIASAAVRTLCQSGRKINVIHQTGVAAAEEIGNYYRKEGVNVELMPFIRDMAAAYRQADLVICRAGATTLAELTALGKPSILIPYPYAADNHQEKNAMAMTEAGASMTFRESDIGAVRLAGEIENIIMDNRRLEAMSDAAWHLGRRNAALHIAEALLELGGRPIELQETTLQITEGILHGT